MGDQRNELANIARSFQSAKKALADAESKQATGDAELVETQKKRSDLEVALNELFYPLKGSEMMRSEAPKKIQTLVNKLGKLMTLDDTIVTTMHVVLAKEPSERGKFDNMTTDELEEDVAKRLQELDKIIVDGESGRAKRAAEVEAASAEFQTLKAQQTAIARAFKSVGKDVENAKQGMQDAAKGVEQILLEESKACKQKQARQLELDVFREGALTTFNELLTLADVTTTECGEE